MEKGRLGWLTFLYAPLKSNNEIGRIATKRHPNSAPPSGRTQPV